jgi:hypothetical protein
MLFLCSCYSELLIDEHLIKNDIVVSTFIANDSLIILNLTETFPVNKPSKKKYITDASIYLVENDFRREKLEICYEPSLHSQSDTVYFYKSNTIKGSINSIYRFEIEIAEERFLYCETTIPKKVEIQGVDTCFIQIITGNEMVKSESFTIRFRDPVDETNFYRLVMKRKNGFVLEGSDTIRVLENEVSNFLSVDPIFSYNMKNTTNEIYASVSNSFLIFDDADNNGKDIEINLSNPLSSSVPFYGIKQGDFTQYIIELHSLTEETYEYLKSIDFQHNSADMFREPAPLYTNIKNGVGICAGYSVSQKIITIGEYPIEGFIYK